MSRDFPGRSGRGFDPNQIPVGQIIKALPIVFAIAALSLVAWRGFYTVAAHEQAVVLRLGKFHGTTGPGLHFMIPLMDEAVPISVQEQRIRIGSSTEDSREFANRILEPKEEALMLTGDLSAAVVEWTVRWRVADPEKFLFSIDNSAMDGSGISHMEAMIYTVAQSVMHRLVGDYSIDEMLTEKRDEVAGKATAAMEATLNKYQCGIKITNLQMQRVTPPSRVKPSFDLVNSSLQNKEKLVNQAKEQRNMLIPSAEADKDKLIQEAKGYAARRRAEVQGEISALLAKYRAYERNKDVTKQRLYLEAMQEVFQASGTKIILDEDVQGLIPLLQMGGPTSINRAGKQ